MDTATENGWDDALARAQDLHYHPSNSMPHRLNATVLRDGSVHLSVESPGETLWGHHWTSQRFHNVASSPLALGVFSEGESPGGQVRMVAFRNLLVTRYAEQPPLPTTGTDHQFEAQGVEMVGGRLRELAEEVSGETPGGSCVSR